MWLKLINKKKREDVSENKKTLVRTQRLLGIKRWQKIQVLNGSCLEDSLDNNQMSTSNGLVCK